MNNYDENLSNDVLRELRKTGHEHVEGDKRHPARRSKSYEEVRKATVAEVEALCNRIAGEIRDDLAAIDSTVGDIAGPMAEQLATGAVADVFEAAAEVLKRRIRSASDEADVDELLPRIEKP